MKINDFFLFFNMQISHKRVPSVNESSKKQLKKIKKSDSLIEL